MSKKRRKHGSFFRQGACQPMGAEHVKRWAAGLVDGESAGTSEKLGLPRLSERILKVAWPLLCSAPKADREDIVAMACMAWNISLLPAEEREKMLVEAVTSLFPDDIFARSSIRGDFDRLIAWKLAEFPDDHRVISNYQVTVTDGEINLVVLASAYLPEGAAAGAASSGGGMSPQGG